MKEIWKDINEFNGLYQISNFGRVKSLSRWHKNNSNTGYMSKEKIIKPRINRDGYLQVCLYKEGKSYTRNVHILVAKAFIPNPLNLPQVNHKNENKLDAKVNNLEWCTRKYNMNYGTRTIRSAQKRSKRVFQYTKDGRLVKEWPSLQSCNEFGFNFKNISACCKGKRKTHKGYKWSYFNKYK